MVEKNPSGRTPSAGAGAKRASGAAENRASRKSGWVKVTPQICGARGRKPTRRLSRKRVGNRHRRPASVGRAAQRASLTDSAFGTRPTRPCGRVISSWANSSRRSLTFVKTFRHNGGLEGGRTEPARKLQLAKGRTSQRVPSENARGARRRLLTACLRSHATIVVTRFPTDRGKSSRPSR